MRFGNLLAMVVLLAGLALTGLVGCGLFTPDSVEGDRAALVELLQCHRRAGVGQE